MRITIPTTGSRGDVQPYVALGVGLQARGHEVCLATHADFESFIRAHGLAFQPLEQGGQALQASDTGDRMLHAGSNAFAFLSEFTRLRRPLLHDLLHRCWLACRGADVILSTSTEFLLAEAVAEREHLPVVWTSLMPLAPSRFRASCLFPPSAVLPGRVPHGPQAGQPGLTAASRNCCFSDSAHHPGNVGARSGRACGVRIW